MRPVRNRYKQRPLLQVNDSCLWRDRTADPHRTTCPQWPCLGSSLLKTDRLLTVFNGLLTAEVLESTAIGRFRLEPAAQFFRATGRTRPKAASGQYWDRTLAAGAEEHKAATRNARFHIFVWAAASQRYRPLALARCTSAPGQLQTLKHSQNRAIELQVAAHGVDDPA